MYQTYSDGPQYIRLATPLQSNQVFGQIAPATGYTRGWHPYYTGDTLMFIHGTAHRMCACSGPMAISSVLGIPKGADKARSLNYDFLYQKPLQLDWVSTEDWRNYAGSFLDGLNYLKRPSKSLLAHENGVYHSKFVGDVSDISVDIDEYPRGYVPFWDHDAFIPKSPGHIPLYRASLIGISEDGYNRYNVLQPPGSSGYDTVHPEIDILDYFDNLENNYGDEGFKLLYSPYSWWHNYYGSFVNSSFRVGNTTFVRVSYIFRQLYNPNQNTSYTMEVQFRVEHTYNIGFQEWFGVKDPNLTLDFDTNTFVLTGSTDVSLVMAQYTGPGGVVTQANMDLPFLVVPYELAPLKHTFNGVQYNRICSLWNDGAKHQVDQTVSNLMLYRMNNSPYTGQVFHKMESKFLNLADEIRPSSFLSVSDAIDSKLMIIQADHLENLSQLLSVLETIPDLPGLVELITKISKGDSSAIRDLIDYVTDAILRFRFTQKPNVEDVNELITLAPDLENLLAQVTKPSWYTAYGSFTYPFTDEENFMGSGSMILTTRSKVRVHLDVSTLMAAFLTLNGIGVFPTLARVWDLVPFSFVVDWFTNEGERIHQLDNQVLLTTMYVDFCVHSYTLTYYPTDDVLTEWNLESDPFGEPFGLRYYRREFSRVVPHLRGSKFDFLRPTHLPNLATAGALVWQVFT